MYSVTCVLVNPEGGVSMHTVPGFQYREQAQVFAQSFESSVDGQKLGAHRGYIKAFAFIANLNEE